MKSSVHYRNDHCCEPLIESLEPRLLLSTFVVTNALASGAGSLRAAIEAANANGQADVIQFDAALAGSAIPLDGTQLDITEALDIQGLGADRLTLTGSDDCRILKVSDDTGTAIAVSISGLTFANGKACPYSVPWSEHGGAIWTYEDLTLTDCVFTDNQASYGGALSIDAGTATLIRCTLSGNRATFGGAICAQGGTTTITDTTIADNLVASGSGGGGVACWSPVTLDGCTVSGNSAYFGGGLEVWSAVVVRNCTLSGNQAGGGNGWGAGVYARDGSVHMTNSTVAYNSGPGNGAGIRVADPCVVTLENTIIAANTSPTEPDLSIGGGTVSYKNCVLTTAPVGPVTDNGGNQVVADANLGALAANGGLTQTHALLTGSPAINAGDNALATAAGLTTDQRGVSRIASGTVDVGAYERQFAISSTPSSSIDEEQVYTYTITTQAAAGAVTITAPVRPAWLALTDHGNGTATLTGTPDDPHISTHNVTIQASDGTTNPTQAFTVTVYPVNDAPVTQVSNTNVDEDAILDVDLWDLVADVETADADLVFAVHDATNGTAVLQGDGHTARFTPTGNFNGPASFLYDVTDTGHGASAATTVTDTAVNVTVNAVNDAPVNTVPGTQITDQDTPVVLPGISVQDIDVDEGTGSLQITLAATDGTVTLSGTAGLAFTAGDGTDDAAMTFTGTTAAVNTALDGLVFTPDAGFYGHGQVDVTTDDLGNTGTPGALTDTDPVVVEVAQTVGGRDVTTFTDANGDKVIVFLRGTGTGQILAADGEDISRIILNGTTDRSVLRIVTRGRGAGTTVGAIDVPGSMGWICGPGVELTGDVTVGGSLKGIQLGDVTGPCTIQIGAAGTWSTRMSFRQVADLSITSPDGVRWITATEWLNTDATTDLIDVLYIGILRTLGNRRVGSAGNFEANLNLTGCNRRGNALGSARIAGSLAGAVWKSVWNIGSIRTRKMENACVYAGVGAGVTGLPDPTADFTSAARLGTFTIIGMRDKSASMINANVAASEIGRANVAYIQQANAGVPCGLAADLISRLFMRDAAGRNRYFGLHAAADCLVLGDWHADVA